MYDQVAQALAFADKNDAVVLAVLTGKGDYYSSGNDLSNFADPQGSLEEMSKAGGKRLNK